MAKKKKPEKILPTDQELLLMRQNIIAIKTQLCANLDAMAARLDQLIPEEQPNRRHVVHGNKKKYWANVVDNYDW